MTNKLLNLKKDIKIYNEYQMLKFYENKLTIYNINDPNSINSELYKDNVNNKLLYKDIYLLLYVQQIDAFLDKLKETNHIRYDKYKQYINPTVYEFLKNT